MGGVPGLGFLLKKYLLKSRKVRSLKLVIADNEFIQLDGEDLSGKAGNLISIEFATQVRMLSLEE
jgi:hypothetical protein